MDSPRDRTNVGSGPKRASDPEGVFDVDGPPMDAVIDALAFWYP